MLLEGSHGVSDDSLQSQEVRRNIVDYYLARCTLVSQAKDTLTLVDSGQEMDRDNETLAGTLMESATSTKRPKSLNIADNRARSLHGFCYQCPQCTSTKLNVWETNASLRRFKQ